MGEGSAVEHGPVGAPGEGVGGWGYLWAWTTLSIDLGAYSESRGCSSHRAELFQQLPMGRPFCREA